MKVLLIIDVQNGFVKKQTQYVVDNLRKLLSKERYDKIIQTRWENYMGSRYEEQLGYTAVGNTQETDTVFHDVGDIVITRCAYSAYTDKLVKNISKDDEIYVCGLETDACVLGTCFSLWDNGYKFKVIENCTGTNAKDLHKPSIKLMQRQFGKDCIV